MNTPFFDITVIGAAVIDVLARPVSTEVFSSGSLPVEETRLSFGGDALNEAAVLACLGKHTGLVTLLGEDEGGRAVEAYCHRRGIDTRFTVRTPHSPTGVNIVLTDHAGERSFLTNPHSTLRKLSPEHFPPELPAAPIVSFASLFVSPCTPIDGLIPHFRRWKEAGATICADMTKTKQGESLSDLAPLLPFIDVLFANREEAERITRRSDPSENARAFCQAGAGCAVIKLGSQGCLLFDGREEYIIPAYPVSRCVDTTGAGDCFAAGFLYALSEGMPLPLCARMGCAAASCSVERLGATEGIQALAPVLERFRSMG